MYGYVTLASVKRYINLDESTDDALLTDFIEWGSRLIDYWKGRRYDIRLETRKYDVPVSGSSQLGSYERAWPTTVPPLVLDDDLLEIVSLHDYNGFNEILPTQYVVESANLYPKTRIRLRNGYSWDAGELGPEQAIWVSGLWGYHENYLSAWDNGSSLTVGVSSSGTSLTVASVAKFAIGNLIKVDNELLLVTGISELALTVERGYNGSVAESHSISDLVKIWVPDNVIVQTCMRLVKWRYAQKDVDLFDKIYQPGDQSISIPTGIPSDVKTILGRKGKPVIL